MTDPIPPKRIFADAKVDAAAARHIPSSAQTEDPAYKLAFQDNDFLLRQDLRPVRFQLELLKPELVMYEPQPGGGMQLVGVDYVVPFTAWTSEEAPTLLGMKFLRNEPLGVWALHIWAWRPNPSGMFAAWNPRVSCAHAR